MLQLKPWQWGILALPPLLIVGFVMSAAGLQIHAWGLNWVWAIVVLGLVGWRWLLARWTRPGLSRLEKMVEAAQATLEAASEPLAEGVSSTAAQQAQAGLEAILQATQSDPPLWEDWNRLWARCQEVVTVVAHAYHPEVKYPLLNIYVPDAYQLIRGTVDDVDTWMEQLSPVLGQVTVGQAVQGYELYRKVEPSARKLWQAWNWAQWLLNPAVAAARTLSQPTSNQATQMLLGNLSQLLREATLRNLYRQAVALYSGELPTLPVAESPKTSPNKLLNKSPKKQLPQVKTQTLRDILDQAEPVSAVAQRPVNLLLVGRTGAGKSSLINTLFNADKAAVDILPSTDQIRSYHWQSGTGDELTLWDSPGYEQVNQSEFRELLLQQAHKADLLLLATPALDPALQMDVDLLRDMRQAVADLGAIAILTQVDRLRPIREWQPPYDWQQGTRPKEKSIREATQYRAEQLGSACDLVIPVVTGDRQTGRIAWNADTLAVELVNRIAPTQQLRLARFLKNQEAKTVAAAKIIQRYTVQMTTTQGLAAFLKSPVLQFLATLTTGSPALAYVLAEQIPVEQLPVVIGKLQMAYDLFQLLSPEGSKLDWLALWPVLLESDGAPDRQAWALGHALVEYWSKPLTVDQLKQRIDHYEAAYGNN